MKHKEADRTKQAETYNYLCFQRISIRLRNRDTERKYRKKSLLAFEMGCYRRRLRIHWKDRYVMLALETKQQHKKR